MEKIEIVMRRFKQNEIDETVLASFDTSCVLSETKENQTLSFPGLTIHLSEHLVCRGETMVPLTNKEFLTLVYLAQHPQWVFSAGQIYAAIWHKDSEDCGTAVSNIIGQIRRKLTPETPKSGYILTVIGGGYKFDVSKVEDPTPAKRVV